MLLMALIRLLMDVARCRIHYVAWCTLVHHGAAWCSTVRHYAARCYVMPHGAPLCNTMLHGDAWRRILLCVASGCCTMLSDVA